MMPPHDGAAEALHALSTRLETLLASDEVIGEALLVLAQQGWSVSCQFICIRPTDDTTGDGAFLRSIGMRDGDDAA